jgi:formylglycine-generating enzyme required for sulfatase activity
MVRVAAGFCIDVTEVTRGNYEIWRVNEGGTILPRSECSPKAGVPSVPSNEQNYLPVRSVDWCDALSFCAAKGKRLCGRIGGGSTPVADMANHTVDQWNNACTSGGVNAYVYGPYFEGDTCNGAGGSFSNVIEAGGLDSCASSVSGYEGVYDLLGNVWEWIDACGSTATNASCYQRGGDWNASDAQTCDDATAVSRHTRQPQTGFRCCAD